METGSVRIYEVTDRVFMVSADNAYDLAHMFCCVQEHYESVSPLWRGKHFKRYQYERWYALNVSNDQMFSYPADWVGFNVPSEAIRTFYYGSPTVDLTQNAYDFVMMRIDRLITGRVGVDEPYYLIGSLDTDVDTMAHEIAHGLYFTNVQYRAEMDQLTANLPNNVWEALCESLREMGYGPNVYRDEIQANLSTPIIQQLADFEQYSGPFIKVFNKYKRTTRQVLIGTEKIA